jgi:hypothetical protein
MFHLMIKKDSYFIKQSLSYFIFWGVIVTDRHFF